MGFPLSGGPKMLLALQFLLTDIPFLHSLTCTDVSSGPRVGTVYKICPFLYVRIYIRMNPIYSLPQFPFCMTSKRKANPLQTRTGPEVPRRLRLPDFKTIGT